MNHKRIVIIGGGISGLTLLHYLKQKYHQNSSIEIILLEKSSLLGGTIHSQREDGCLFESGPNGFLNSKPQTLALIRELDLESELVSANEYAKLRYLSIRGKLNEFPTNPMAFLKSSILNPLEKLRILGELFVSIGKDENETVYDFGKRRLGERFSQVFLDPMVSGVFGGNVKELKLKEAFPKIYELEHKYGSLIKAAIALKKENKMQSDVGAPKGTLMSFKHGMGTLIESLEKKYKDSIRVNQDVLRVVPQGKQFSVQMQDESIEADQVFLSLPAYRSSELIRNFDPQLSEAMDNIFYAPMAVVGLCYLKKAFRVLPKGFGYLIPSSEGQKVLGVLFDSHVYSGRSLPDQVMFRVMIGGARHPDIHLKSKDELVSLAVEEIKSKFSVSLEPQKTFFMLWPKAIPQYDQRYVQSKKIIQERLKSYPTLRIVSNYWGGVSVNDCVENAYQAASQNILS